MSRCIAYSPPASEPSADAYGNESTCSDRGVPNRPDPPEGDPMLQRSWRLLMLLPLVLTGCASMTPTDKGVLAGGGLGALAGGLIGSQSGNTALGAAAGGVLGGVAGGLTGNAIEQSE